VTTSGKAIASLVIGILGLVICPLLGTLAIVLGMMAKADIRRSAGRLVGGGLAVAGIVLGVIWLVVMVPAMLAAIVIPNFLEAQTRAKVARVQSDSRSLATAIESFAVDKNTYPTRLSELTSPVAYITALPLDPFADKAEQNPEMRWLAYTPVPRELERGQTRSGAWILASRGPDGVFSVDFARDLPAGKQLNPDEIQGLLLDKTYDPSNGTNSAGDVFRFSTGDWASNR
jgi:type II secretory pathway pseudopilin PulG